MRAWTYTQFKGKVLNDLDMVDEDFITEEEWLDYANEAIDECEQIVHTLGRESLYFLTSAPLELVDGTASYDLPEDIYGNKIVNITFDDGSTSYEIKRIRDLRKIPCISESDNFRYLLTNSADDGYKIKLYPTPAADDTTSITIWYIRNAKQMEEDDDELDLPEAVNFVIQHMKVRAYEKEGHPNVVKAMSDLAKQRELLEGTLSEMVVDGDSDLPGDLDFYQEHV